MGTSTLLAFPIDNYNTQSGLSFTPLESAIIGIILACVILMVSYYAIIPKYCGNSKYEELELDNDHSHDPMTMLFTCEICEDSKPEKESFDVKGCTHSYCSDCIENYVELKLQDGISQITCPVTGCPGVLEPEYCREILPFEVYSQWGNLLCESMILESQKFYCPFKDCSALMINDGGEVVTNAECPSCNRMFCAQCKVGWHSGVGCAEYQRGKGSVSSATSLFRRCGVGFS